MSKRAKTEAEKRAVVESLLTSWVKCPELRLGQLVVNAECLTCAPLFYVEDIDLAGHVATFADGS